MNEKFSELVSLLIESKFNKKLKSIKFSGESEPVKIVSYHGITDCNKRFWGRFKLDDQVSLVDWIEINIEGKFYRFSYHYEAEESFVQN